MHGFDLSLHVVPVALGIVAGVFAFAPLAWALRHVIAGENRGSMVQGVLGLMVSCGVAGLVIVLARLFAPAELVAVAIGETAGFLVCLIGAAVAVMVRSES